MGEKRQRVDSGPAITQNVAAVIAQAIAKQREEEEESRAMDLSVDQGKAKEHTPTVFQSDPHLSMRILSLPILDSLVRNSIVSWIPTPTDRLQVYTNTVYAGARPIL
jgi:hypothetical protein